MTELKKQLAQMGIDVIAKSEPWHKAIVENHWNKYQRTMPAWLAVNKIFTIADYNKNIDKVLAELNKNTAPIEKQYRPLNSDYQGLSLSYKRIVHQGLFRFGNKTYGLFDEHDNRVNVEDRTEIKVHLYHNNNHFVMTKRKRYRMLETYLPILTQKQAEAVSLGIDPDKTELISLVKFYHKEINMISQFKEEIENSFQNEIDEESVYHLAMQKLTILSNSVRHQISKVSTPL